MVDYSFVVGEGERGCQNRERSQFVVPSSVANGGFAPLGGAAATPVAALKTPVAVWKEGSGVVETKKVRPFHKHLICNRLYHYSSLPPSLRSPHRSLLALRHPAPLLPGGGDHWQRLFIHYFILTHPLGGGSDGAREMFLFY